MIFKAFADPGWQFTRAAWAGIHIGGALERTCIGLVSSILEPDALRCNASCGVTEKGTLPFAAYFIVGSGGRPIKGIGARRPSLQVPRLIGRGIGAGRSSLQDALGP